MRDNIDRMKGNVNDEKEKVERHLGVFIDQSSL